MRLSMPGPSISRIKKLFFSALSKCPIDLFGPVANGRILKRLHARSEFALLVSLQAASSASRARPLWPPQAPALDRTAWVSELGLPLECK